MFQSIGFMSRFSCDTPLPIHTRTKYQSLKHNQCKTTNKHRMEYIEVICSLTNNTSTVSSDQKRIGRLLRYSCDQLMLIQAELLRLNQRLKIAKRTGSLVVVSRVRLEMMIQKGVYNMYRRSAQMFSNQLLKMAC